MKTKNWELTLNTHLNGTFYAVKYAIPAMSKNKANEDGEKGVIINVSSVLASMGHKNGLAYSVAKSAIEGMNVGLARDLRGTGIRVATIKPGFFDTPMLKGFNDGLMNQIIADTASGRVGKPSEMAQFAQQIIENPFINGQTLTIDGGILLRDL